MGAASGKPNNAVFPLLLIPKISSKTLKNHHIICSAVLLKLLKTQEIWGHIF